MQVNSKDNKEDFKLIRKVISGNMKAFELLIDKHKLQIKSVIYHFRAAEHEYDDIYQLALIKMWRQLKGFKFQSSFSTWYYRVCRNLFLDEKRRVKNSKCISLEDLRGVNSSNDSDNDIYFEAAFKMDVFGFRDDVTTPYEKLDRKELKLLTERIINKLSDNHKMVLTLFVDGFSYREIAAKMKSSIGTVMSRLFYARENFKRLLCDPNIRILKNGLSVQSKRAVRRV